MAIGDILDTSFEGKKIELSDNLIGKGDDINVTSKDPSMKKILIGAGWDTNSFDADMIDVDLSLFMIGKDGMTRIDEDFIYYNNRDVFDGGIKHNFDSRTGAGDGDDESISIDLQSVPFEIISLVFVLSIYKGEEKSQNLGMLRNIFIRLVNAETGYEMLRYVLDEYLQDQQQSGCIIATLDREGPKWHFRSKAELVEGGLKILAARFGLVVAQQ